MLSKICTVFYGRHLIFVIFFLRVGKNYLKKIIIAASPLFQINLITFQITSLLDTRLFRSISTNITFTNVPQIYFSHGHFITMLKVAENEDRQFLGNVCKHVGEYTLSPPTRPQFTYSPPRRPQMSYVSN
jgi:hypothetical protein